MRKFTSLLLASTLLVAACQASTDTATENKADKGVTEASILKAENTGWLSHGRTYSEQRHSPLAQINSDNVKDMGLSWSYDLGTARGIEVTPIVSDGIMYVTSTWNIVTALDAKTGALVWEHDPEVDRSRAQYLCCDVVNRGVAIWGDTIVTATVDGRLVALDAKTGKKKWDTLTIDLDMPYTMTGAPRIVKGKVIIGNGGAELGVRGYVSAYDIETGEMDWRFFTVPGNPAKGYENAAMEMAAKTWQGEYWKAGGGGTAWDSMAYDPELDLLYVGVGNGSPWNHVERSEGVGDNLFLSSIVAVRPDTGEYVWHYQTTPGETWDYTATQHMILADLEIEGRTRQVIMQAPKNGFFFVIDRATGEYISAKPFVPTNWALEFDADGRPIELPDARYEDKAPHLQLPGPLGAHNWHPMSYSPDTGLVYIPAQEAPWVYANDADYEYRGGPTWNTGTDFKVAGLPNDEPTFQGMKSMLKGRLLAWDPVKQEKVWSYEHGGPWNGGVLSTSGNLVFQGAADANFAAYNAKTGERLWDMFTQTGIVAAPITYEIDGEQYVAVASGWGGSYAVAYGGAFPTGSAVNTGRVLVFKAGGKETLPDLEVDVVEIPTPPKQFADADMLAMGGKIFANNCSACHGDQAYSIGLNPNLRYSTALGDSELWKEIIEGGLEMNGMPNFKGYLTPEQIEGTRAYVVEEANSSRTKEFYDRMSGRSGGQ